MSILVVSEKQAFRDYWTRRLQEKGHEADSVGSLDDYNKRLQKGPVYLVLLDVRFDDKVWSKIQNQIEETYHHIKVHFDDGEDMWWEKMPSGEAMPRLADQLHEIEEALEEQKKAYELEEHELPIQGSLLKKITLKRSFGFYLEEGRFYFAETRLTLGGRVWVRWAMARFTGETFRLQCERLLFPHGIPKPKSKQATWVFAEKFPFVFRSVPQEAQEDETDKIKMKLLNDMYLGASIPGKAVFFGCSTLSDKVSRKVGLAELLVENPRFNFIDTPDISADWFTAKGGEESFVFLGAAQKKFVQSVLQKFYSGGLQPQRIEPEPCAALRGALLLAPSHNAGKFEIRILFGHEILLAVLVRNGYPYSWQFLSADEAKFNENLGAGIRALSTHAQWKLKEPDFPRIVLQGSQALSQRVSWVKEQFPSAEVVVAPSPESDGAFTALGASLGAMDAETTTINLARFVQKPPSIWTVFPKMEAVVTGVMVTFVLLNILLQIFKYDRTYKRVKNENSFYSWSSGKSPVALEAEKRKLQEQMEPLGNFLGRKFNWTPYLVEISNLVPPEVQAMQMLAQDQIWEKNSSGMAGAQSFTINIRVNLIPGAKMPPVVDQCLNSFRDSALFKKELPKVELSSINWRREGAREEVHFILYAIPQVGGGTKAEGGKD